MTRPRLRLLSDEIIGQILQEAGIVLRDLGVEVHDEEAAGLLLEAGARRSSASGRVLLDEALVDRALSAVPGSFALHDRDGAVRARLGSGRTHFTPGSSAVNFLDGGSGRSRLPSTEDYVRYAILAGRLEAIDYPSTAFIPADVPGRIADSYRLYLSLIFGTGPVVTGAFGVDGLDVMFDLLEAIRGSRESLAAAPLAVFSCCPTAPLRWSREACATLVCCARRGIPVEIIPMPLTGFVAPGTLVGTLVQHTAEMLSGIALAQASAEGAPILWGGSPAIFDYRFESTPMGAIETQMIDCGAAEIGAHAGLPTQAYMGLSDSKLLDAQAGMESAAGTVLAVLSAVDSVSGPGMLAFENCFSLEKLVLDNEICAMGRRLAGGIDLREGEFPALPQMEELVREGHLIISDRTRRWFGEEVRFPGSVIDRHREADGQAGGLEPLAERARRRVEELLGDPAPLLEAPRRRELEGIMSRAAKGAGMDRLPAHGR